MINLYYHKWYAFATKRGCEEPQFLYILFLIIWLSTIFILRHRLAGHKIKLRDALYNAMTPLVSTFLVFIVALIQCIPIFILIIVYSAAVQTEFLSTPFYALVFFIFAAVMIGGLLRGDGLASSIKRSADFISAVVADAIAADEPVRDGVQLEKNLYRLL